MQKAHLLLYATTLGIGAAMPIGPVNLEIIRRNLHCNTRSGILLGLGATCTDVTYVLLLCLGAVKLLNHPIFLQIVTIFGAFILAWFGLSALRSKTASAQATDSSITSINIPAWKHWRDGYIMTAINPMTILFWTSISSQIASLSNHNHITILIMASGIIIGAFGWVLGLSVTLHYTRHRISSEIAHRLNQLGGILLLGFSAFGLFHALCSLG